MEKFYSTVFMCIFFISQNFFSQSCTPSFIPDMPLQTVPPAMVTEINTIYETAKYNILASAPPTTASLNASISAYNNLNISVINGAISGKPITSFDDVSFINTFADYLKFNPTDSLMIERIQNTIWWVSNNLCNGTLAPDYGGYSFRNFGRKAAFCLEYSDLQTKNRFLYIIERNSSNWNFFWKADYNYDTQLTDGTVSSDFVYNFIELLIPLVKCFDSASEQYRYMVSLKRYITRFASVYTNGTQDGLKPDGSGFHHWNNYEAYMYAYNSIISCLKIFDKTSFQIDSSAYKVFRNAIMHKLLTSNDSNIIPLCLTGRSGNWDDSILSKGSLKDLALIGGNILGLGTADPLLAGIYNRKYGVEPSFNYNNVSNFNNGFYQNNFANMGAFRTKNTIIINKGFNNQLWGSEIFVNSNRFGRYQSYGAMAIVYPGNRNANGFDNKKWDWNFNPGATTKILPWGKLIAGWDRIDEYSDKRFAGSLQFNLKKEGFLDNVWGTYGMFAMDFREKKKLGFGTVTAQDTHDDTFTFKKTSFFFDDMIICLGSDINNSDLNYPTVTTLYQNCTNASNVIVNNQTFDLTDVITDYSENQDNWLVDNFGTGYYIIKGSGKLSVQRSTRATPSHDQINPAVLNAPSQAAIGYIDHGFSPDNSTYEYVVFPNTNIQNMQSVSYSFQNISTKPYDVISKDKLSHIIKHKATGIFAFALFEVNTSLPGNTNIVGNDFPCMIMYQPNADNTEMKLSLANPDLGLSGVRSYEKFSKKNIRITLNGIWSLLENSSDVNLISVNGNTTTFEFLTYQGLPIEVTFVKNNNLESKISKKSDTISGTMNTPEKSITITPNPAQLEVSVMSPFIGSWNIIDITGKTVLSGRTLSKKFKIDISSLLKGTYFISMERHIVKFIKN